MGECAWGGAVLLGGASDAIWGCMDMIYGLNASDIGFGEWLLPSDIHPHGLFCVETQMSYVMLKGTR